MPRSCSILLAVLVGSSGCAGGIFGGEDGDPHPGSDPGVESGDPLAGDPLAGDPLPGDPLPGDPLVGDPLAGDPLVGDPLVGDPLPGDPLPGDPVAGDPQPPPVGLLWPIDCVPGDDCYATIGYPDTDDDGVAFDCGSPGYTGHTGTDIGFSWARLDAGMDVYAAAAGEVLWVFDGKYDRCPDAGEPDCQAPTAAPAANVSSGYMVCTDLGDYCGAGRCCCLWCFYGANVVVIRHFDLPGVFATRYDHLRNGSIVVSEGEVVTAGQKIAQAASAGNSSGPHLHFEVWGEGYYDPVEPWAGACGPNADAPLWLYDPPWSGP